MHRTCQILVASPLGLGPRALICQETIIADRPGIRSTSFVVSGGTLQLEAGAEFAHSDADLYNPGHILVRFGLPWFELGAQFNSFVIKRSAEDEDGEGFQVVDLRIKGRLWNPTDVALTVSLMGTLNFPTGSTFLTGDEVIPTVTRLGDYTITDRWALSSNLAYTFGPGELIDLVLVTLTPSLVIAPSVGLGAYASGVDLHSLKG